MPTIEITDTDEATLEFVRASLADYPWLMTADQAAAALNTSTRTIADATRAGEIRAMKLGRSWQYPREALVAWMATRMPSARVREEDPPAPQEAQSWAAGRSPSAKARGI